MDIKLRNWSYLHLQNPMLIVFYLRFLELASIFSKYNIINFHVFKQINNLRVYLSSCFFFFSFRFFFIMWRETCCLSQKPCTKLLVRFTSSLFIMITNLLYICFFIKRTLKKQIKENLNLMYYEAFKLQSHKHLWRAFLYITLDIYCNKLFAYLQSTYKL